MPDTEIDDYFAAAFIRGMALQGIPPELPSHFLETPLDELADADLNAIVNFGKDAELKLHRFKKSLGALPRIKKILGFLQGVMPQSILDVGSGRGAFLWPCLRMFPLTSVTAMDTDKRRFELYKAVQLGGVENLHAEHFDIRSFDAPDKSFDIVTALEVLEHIETPEDAVRNAVRLAQRFVAISVPSKEDDNPQHLHLLTEPVIREMLAEAGCHRVRVDYTLGHLLAIASL